ncbi:hypothetical protein ACSSS7_005736 [Eimeria intestinalis]
MKTEALDAAIHDVLLTYAQVKNLEEQHHEKELLGDPQTEEEEAEEGKAEDAATAAKRSKMLRVARMLVDSSPRQRNKGMASVARFLESFQELTEDELLHVWSTLYYAAWLSDKPLIQRDFFVRASLLHRRLRCPRAKTLFFCSFFRVLIAEWGKLDRHRTNKFLLFCRIFFAEWMHVLRVLEWEETVVKKATEFLYKEVLLQGNARGVALHLVDVLTDEFQGLMESAPPSVTEGESAEAALTPDQTREERLRAFSWLFVPFLRCCCFSADAALVSHIHERSLRSLSPQDVDLNYVAETLFALASDKRVREENRKRLFVSHEHIKEEAAGGPPSGEAASDRRIGSFTPSTFARLMVQRVIPDSPANQQRREQPQHHPQRQQQPLDGLHELVHESAHTRKRQASADGPSSAAQEAQASPKSSSASGSLFIQSSASQIPEVTLSKRAKKRMRMQQQQKQMEFSGSQMQAANERLWGGTMQKAVKHKLKVLTADKGKVEAKTPEALTSPNSLRLPIDSSAVKGVCYAAADGSSSASSSSSAKPSRKEEAAREVEASSPVSSGCSRSSPSDTKREGHSSADDSEPQEEAAEIQQATSLDSMPAGSAASSEEDPSSFSCSSRRRSPRSLEAASVPSSKRVLFNLRKNKVVGECRSSIVSTYSARQCKSRPCCDCFLLRMTTLFALGG